MRFAFAPFLVVLAGCPNPVPRGSDACVSCHVGIEPIHPQAFGDGECVVCHGGDPDARDKEDAHVPIPEDWAEIRGDALPPAPEGYIKDFAPAQLDALPVEYVQFVNPGDMRAVPRTCGTCHSRIAETFPTSVMTTNSAHYLATRMLAGLQGRDAIYSSYAVEDPDCDGSVEGAPCALERLDPQPDDEVLRAFAEDDLAALEEIAIDHYLSKSCGTCHASGYGKNNSPHLYRSTGCSSCHVLYGKDGVYEGGDEAIPDNTPVYAARHEITRAIPTEQCATCHFQGGRIGLHFRGIRESGFADVPEDAVPWNEVAYGHVPGFYLLDEDGTTPEDETPPDVHFERGMHCADCHVGADVHGDGNLYSTAKLQVGIRCEDCHGTVRAPVQPDDDGLFRTSGGQLLRRLTREPDGTVVLTGIVDGARHVVPQPAEILADGGTEAMHAAMAPNEEGWSHTDSLTCDTCHTSYNLMCIGCHVSYDARLDQRSDQTGRAHIGLVRGGRQTYTLDHTLLGLAPDGRVQSVVPSAHLQLTIIDPDGERRLGGPALDEDGNPTGPERGAFRVTDASDANIGFAPFFQHTTTDRPRTCDTCHRRDDSPEELARVRGVYGYGTGEFMLPNPEGPPVDALRFLDDDGEPITEWWHRNTGPVPPARRQRALDVILDAR